MKKKILSLGVVIILLAMLFSLTGCSNSVREKDLIDVLPKEITEYTFNEMPYTSNIEKLDIVRKNTANGVDTIYCELHLKDELFERIEYLCLIGGKGTNGWFLQDWNTYDNEIIVNWNTKDIKNLVDNELTSLGYEDYEEISCEFVDDTEHYGSSGLFGEDAYSSLKRGSYTFNIDKKYPNLSLKGTFKADIILEYYISPEYPKNYYTTVSVDTSNLEKEWNIDGKWYCESEKLTINSKLEQATSNRVNLTLEGSLICDNNETSPRSETLNQGSGFSWNLYNMELTCGISVGCSHVMHSHRYTVKFTPFEAFIDDFMTEENYEKLTRINDKFVSYFTDEENYEKEIRTKL